MFHRMFAIDEKSYLVLSAENIFTKIYNLYVFNNEYVIFTTPFHPYFKGSTTCLRHIFAPPDVFSTFAIRHSTRCAILSVQSICFSSSISSFGSWGWLLWVLASGRLSTRISLATWEGLFPTLKHHRTWQVSFTGDRDFALCVVLDLEIYRKWVIYQR